MPRQRLLIDAVTDWTVRSAEQVGQRPRARPQALRAIGRRPRAPLGPAPEDADGDFYAWIAGESATIKTLRRLLVSG